MLQNLRARLSDRLARHIPSQLFAMRNTRPLVTFTFDDVPLSAQLAAAPRLEAHGAQGTFYIATGLMGVATEHWTNLGPEGILALHEAGHEIGCHGHAHRRVHEFSIDEFLNDLTIGKQKLLDIEPSLALENFAFPFGRGGLRAKRKLKPFFRSSRGIVRGVNRGKIDLQFLRSNPLIEGLLDRVQIDALLDRTVASNGWLIFYSHDVDKNPSPYGCSPGLLEYALRGAHQRKLANVTLSRGLDLIGAP